MTGETWTILVFVALIAAIWLPSILFALTLVGSNRRAERRAD